MSVTRDCFVPPLLVREGLHPTLRKNREGWGTRLQALDSRAAERIRGWKGSEFGPFTLSKTAEEPGTLQTGQPSERMLTPKSAACLVPC
jgi:hypothetical protein